MSSKLKSFKPPPGNVENWKIAKSATGGYIKMVESKYGKYVIKDAIVEGKFAPRIVLEGDKHIDGANYTMIYNCITEPFLMIEHAHSHDYDQFLCFIGGNPADVGDFGAEVELYLDGEKITITSTTIFHIPKGLVHCPLNFKRIDKPIVF